MKTLPTTLELEIDVTQQDIDEGRPDNCCYCPIARATRKAAKCALRDVKSILTLRTYAYWDRIVVEVWVTNEPGGYYMSEAPSELRLFMHSFDNAAKHGTEPPVPFKATLTLTRRSYN